MLSIAFSQTNYYIDSLSENIKRGVRQKLRNGIWPQWAPMGYLNDRKTSSIVVDVEKAPFIRKAFELYSTGDFAVAEVRNRVNRLGLLGRLGRTLSVSNYHVLLQNPIYYGAMRFNGELHKAKHDPIVTKRLFDRVQEVMLRKSKPKTPLLKSYRYRGLFRCGECGCTITTETQKGHNYLRCTKRRVSCAQKYVREEVVARQISEAIGTVGLPSEWAEQMLEAVRNEQAEMQQAAKASIERLEEELSACEARLDLLLDLALTKTISQSEYASKKGALIKAKTDIREKLTASAMKSAGRFEPLTRFVKEANQAVFLSREQNPDAHRDFLKKHGSNFQLTEGFLRVEFKNPWKTVAKFTSASTDTLAPQRENVESKPWRRGGDSNPRYGF